MSKIRRDVEEFLADRRRLEDLVGALRRTAEIEPMAVTDPYGHAREVDRLITQYGVADDPRAWPENY
jgi:hypothetical protein